jgi:hypothetical protein
MRLKLVKTEEEGHCSVCGEPCRVRCPQHDGSRFRRPLGELWRLALLTISAMSWLGLAFAAGWLIAIGRANGLYLLATLLVLALLLSIAFRVWETATGRRDAPQKIIHVHRRWL